MNRTILLNAERFRKAIYKRHNFKCAACKEALYGEEEVHLHHVIARKDGGQYTLNNIVRLHKTCHEGITHAKKS